MNLRLLASTLLIASSLTVTHAADTPALPEPWKHHDIGSGQVGKPVPPVPVEKFGKNALFGKSGMLAGSAKHADGVFTLDGTMDIWGPMDGGHFVWQPVQGDFVFVARVASMGNPGNNKHAKASLCIRESLEGGSRRVAQTITPVDGTQFLYREATDDKTVRVMPDAVTPPPSVPKEKFPCWLTGTIKLDLKADALIGLASTSHTTDSLTTSVFDHVTLTKTSK